MDEKELDKMAKDIEPIEEPKETTTTEAPVGFVEDKETYVKPDGETTTAPVRTPNVIKEESGKGKWVLRGFATILILGLGAGSAWLYTDAQSVRNELQSTKTGLDAARADAAKLRSEVSQSQPAQEVEKETPKLDEELIVEEARVHILARTDTGGKKPQVSIAGNKNGFATVKWDNGPKPGQSNGINYFLKKIEDRWVVVANSPEGLTEDEYELYGIPTDQ